MSRRVVVSVLAVTMVLTLALASGCAAKPTATPKPKVAATATSVPVPPTEPPPSKETLKVGVLLPFTGDFAWCGEEQRVAFEMVMDDIDWTVGNYQIEAVWIDSAGDPEQATRNYEQAIVKDKISTGFSDQFSSVSVAVMEVAAKYKVPHFFSQGATGVINDKYLSDPEKYGYWMGKLWARAEGCTFIYAEAAEEAIRRGMDPGDRTFVAVGDETDWGRTVLESAVSDFEERGWTLLDKQFTAQGETDFYPLLAKWKGLNPTVVFTTAAGNCVAAFVKQMDEVGLKAFTIGDCLAADAKWYDMAGEGANYVVDRSIGWRQTDDIEAILAEYKTRYNGTEPAVVVGGLTYDGAKFLANVLSNALDRYGELTGETIYKYASDEINGDGLSFKDGIVMTEYKYTADTMPDPIIGEGYWILPVVQFMHGKYEVVWPPSLATAELQVPPELLKKQ